MKLLALLFTFTLSLKLIACEVKPLNSCRDSYTKHISKSKTKRALRSINKDKLLKKKIDNIFNKATIKTTHQEIFKSLLKIPSLKSRYEICQQDTEHDKESLYCLKYTLSKPIYYSYAKENLDATATIILLSKLSDSKKSAFTGTLSSYARKVSLLRKSYLKNQTNTTSSTSPLSQKKFLKKFGRLKKLTPRQHTLFKFNYSQIKHMGKIMQSFEKRILALKSGLFFDYDGDGENDETYFLDEADKYRMSVKLLKLELQKKSNSGEIFSGSKPDFHDLLVASNELGLISDKDLQSMVELPFLYEPKTSPWKKAGEITWAIGKGLIMAIPGANLYSIIPIVLIESYATSREQQNETSDLHLFTF